MVDADDGRRVLEVVDHARDRSALVVDRKRMEHQPEEAVPVGQRVSWSSVTLRGWSWTARQAACETSTGASPLRCEHLCEERGRGMGEIEDHAERESRSTRAPPSFESPPSSAAPSAYGLRRFQVSDAIRRPSSQNESAGHSS